MLFLSPRSTTGFFSMIPDARCTFASLLVLLETKSVGTACANNAAAAFGLASRVRKEKGGVQNVFGLRVPRLHASTVHCSSNLHPRSRLPQARVNVDNVRLSSLRARLLPERVSVAWQMSRDRGRKDGTARWAMTLPTYMDHCPIIPPPSRSWSTVVAR